MKLLILCRGKKYRWSCPEWVKLLGAGVILTAIMYGLFALYAAAVGHPVI